MKQTDTSSVSWRSLIRRWGVEIVPLSDIALGDSRFNFVRHDLSLARSQFL